MPGRNVGVIGADGTDAVRVLAAAALSLDAQHDRDGEARFVLAPLVAEALARRGRRSRERLSGHA